MKQKDWLQRQKSADMNLTLSLQHKLLAAFIKALCCKTHDKTGITHDSNFMLKYNPTELLLRIRQLTQVGVQATELLAELSEEFELQ